MSSEKTTQPLDLGLNVKLSTMMFLQYAIWGAWLPLLWPYLSGHRGFEPAQIGDMFAVGAIGAIVAPFIAGQIADRWFNTEKFLGISHIIGGILVWQLASIETYNGFLMFSLLYSLIYSPTLALTNSLSFHHLPDRDRDFGRIRVWGTVGWIVVGIGIGQWLLSTWTPDKTEPAKGITVEAIYENPGENIPKAIAANPGHLDGILTTNLVQAAESKAWVGLLKEQKLNVPTKESDGKTVTDEKALATEIKKQKPEVVKAAVLKQVGDDLTSSVQAAGMADAFRLSGILGVLMGLFCFALPSTPPSQGQSRSATREAWWAIRKQPLITLFFLAVPVSCIHQFYFVHTAGFLGNLQADAEGFITSINKIFGVGGGGLMTIGQMSELLVLALIPTLAKGLSRKTFLAIGLLAYAGRMALFSYADVVGLGGIIAGVALHGLCFGCFIFVAFMIVDEETTDDSRASAQSLFNLVIIGIGIIVGSQIATKATEWATMDGSLSFKELFSYPMYASLVCLLLLALFYPSKGNQKLEQ